MDTRKGPNHGLTVMDMAEHTELGVFAKMSRQLFEISVLFYEKLILPKFKLMV